MSSSLEFVTLSYTGVQGELRQVAPSSHPCEKELVPLGHERLKLAVTRIPNVIDVLRGVYSTSVLFVPRKKLTNFERYSLPFVNSTEVPSLVLSSSIALISARTGAATSPALVITCQSACANFRSMLVNRSPPALRRTSGEVVGSNASLRHLVQAVQASISRPPLA